jgi:hypothetical protein
LDHPKNALPVEPDHLCQTGSTHGFDIAIWECHEENRVVAWRTSAEMSCSEVQRESTDCGGVTDFERTLSEGEKEECFGSPPPDAGM